VRSHRLVFVSLALLALLPVGTAGAAKRPTKHARATSVNAVEVEWHVKLSRTSVPTGPVTFVARDAGKLAHQFIVLRTNLAAAKLPMKGAQVDLNRAGTVVGETRHIVPGKTVRLTLTLKPGRYVLLCNLPAHYKAGQFTAFRVT
jgi:hypothetical protein